MPRVSRIANSCVVMNLRRKRADPAASVRWEVPEPVRPDIRLLLVGGGQVTRQGRIEDKRGRVHDIEVTV